MLRFLTSILIPFFMVGCVSAPDVQNVPTRALRVAGPTQLSYAVTGQSGASPMRGARGELVWWQDGSRYDARLTLKVLHIRLFSQHSTGRIGASGIEPERYSYSREYEAAAHFLRDHGKVQFSNNAPSVPLLEGAQDRLSVMMQVGAMLAGDPARYPVGTRIPFQTVGPSDAGVWVFVVGEDEKVALPAGEYTVRKLIRNPRRESDRKLELWLAPAHGYLPVRVRQTDTNGDFFEMQLRDPLVAKTN